MSADGDRFKRMRALFDEAIERPAAEREAAVRAGAGDDPSLCAAVLALISADVQGGGLMDKLASSSPPASRAPEQVGPYKVVRLLGQGGMGCVYEASRSDDAFHKKVALKLLRPELAGTDFVVRFRNERQILAGLEHPNIARILDGGATPEGLPYYVMERVDGRRLDDYCEAGRLGMEARIRLFQQICRAVDYLHKNQVIHRDLKPSNVLVAADGVAKLLDFGIARCLTGSAEETRDLISHGRIMTPAYASPEQVSGGNVTPAADIWALGIVLAELLTGRRMDTDAPAQESAPRVSQALREDLREEVMRTGMLKRVSLSDLDAIVAKALKPRPESRYASAGQFSEDLDRLLELRPVVACQTTTLARAGKYVRRNRIPVAVAALLLALAGGGAWQALEARMQQARADTQEREIDDLLKLLAGRLSAWSGGLSAAEQRNDVMRLDRALETKFAAEIARSPGRTSRRDGVISRAIDYLGNASRFAAAPDVRREIGATYRTIARIQAGVGLPGLGDRNGALDTYSRAVNLLSGLPEDADSGATLRNVLQEMALLGAPATPGGQRPVRPAVRTAAAPTTERSRPQVPPQPASTAAAQPEPPANAPALDELRMTEIEVKAKAAAAEESVKAMRENLARQGLSLRPDVVAAMARIRAYLEEAHASLARSDADSAREALRIAAAESARVLKILGQ